MTNVHERQIQRLAAFSATPAGGNPAGVVLDAEGLSDRSMRDIAAQVGYSETAFLDRSKTAWRLRYFSPVEEVGFCGHATIATAVALAAELGPQTWQFETASGAVSVETSVDDDGRTWATLTSPPLHSRAADPRLVRSALAALNWSVF